MTQTDNFNAYNNVYYYDTVIKGMPEFFINYDAKYAPQDHLLTLDYPILKNYRHLTGIDLIEKYIYCICLEQKFLNSFSEEEVITILDDYEFDYRESVINIASLVLRAQLEKNFLEEVESLSRIRLSKAVWFCLKYQKINDNELYSYLVKYVDEYIVLKKSML